MIKVNSLKKLEDNIDIDKKKNMEEYLIQHNLKSQFDILDRSIGESDILQMIYMQSQVIERNILRQD